MAHAAPILLRPPPPLLLPNRYLRELSAKRRLPRQRSIFLLHVAVRGVPDVVCCCPGGDERCVVSDYPLWGKEVEGEWMEGAEFVGCFVGYCAGGECFYCGECSSNLHIAICISGCLNGGKLANYGPGVSVR